MCIGLPNCNIIHLKMFTKPIQIYNKDFSMQTKTNDNIDKIKIIPILKQTH